MLTRWRPLNNQSGSASMEMIPVIVVIALLINFGLGFFGVIQTGILNSIAARNYAFETFRNRANLNYFRDVGPFTDSYKLIHSRSHSVVSENRPTNNQEAWVSLRNIGFSASSPTNEGSVATHEPGTANNQGVFGIQEHVRYQDEGTSPVWIRPIYGICLDAKCSK